MLEFGKKTLKKQKKNMNLKKRRSFILLECENETHKTPKKIESQKKAVISFVGESGVVFLFLVLLVVVSVFLFCWSLFLFLVLLVVVSVSCSVDEKSLTGVAVLVLLGEVRRCLLDCGVVPFYF